MYTARWHRIWGTLGSVLTVVGGLTHYIPSATLKTVAVIGGLVMTLGTDVFKALKGDGPATDIGLK
jgi:hypothetical protein